MKVHRLAVMAGAVASALALTVGMAIAPASASPSAVTHHGVFTSGVGVNTGVDPVPAGTDLDLRASGVWNLNITGTGVEVTGNYRVFAWGAGCDRDWGCDSSIFSLQMGTPWTETAPGSGVYTSSYPRKPVPGFGVVMTLYYPGVNGADATLRVDIAGSGFGWTSWTLTGTEDRP